MNFLRGIKSLICLRWSAVSLKGGKTKYFLPSHFVCQKLVRWNNGTKVLSLFEKHKDTEVVAGALGEEWKSAGVPDSAANDKHEALTHDRSCYRVRSMPTLNQRNSERERM